MTSAVLLVAVPAVALFPGVEHLADGLRAGVTGWSLLAFAAVAVVGAALKGISGFGYSLLVTPVAALIIDPTLAVVVLAIPPLMLNVFQVGETGTGRAYVRQNWALFAFGLVGSVAGVALLSAKPDQAILSVLVAVILLAHITFQLTRRFATAPRAGHPVLLSVVGVVQGFLLGAVNLGPVLPAYLQIFERNAQRYIGGMSLFFAVVIGERVVQMWLQGVLTEYRIWLGSTIALVTLFGLALGTVIRRRFNIDKRRLDAVITALLLATAVNLLWKALPQLLG
ncbi:sulfite exporter TauE/SafE family protein [Saccharopolyspora sp. SCSIO 74807]|uniref:sulfite exporter TauE/SafE family protein n=1 Tax=Saccharopolyspora sp. SCSIO 74807 TaxID=3118084 RepID=UPI0030D3C534